MKTPSLLVLVLFASAAQANPNQCHLVYSTYMPNVLGRYTIKKKLFQENYRSSSEECYTHVQQVLAQYHNVKTSWTHIDLTYLNEKNQVASKAAFTKK